MKKKIFLLCLLFTLSAFADFSEVVSGFEQLTVYAKNILLAAASASLLIYLALSYFMEQYKGKAGAVFMGAVIGLIGVSSLHQVARMFGAEV